MQNLVFLYSIVFVLLNIVVDLDHRLARPEDPLPMSAPSPIAADSAARRAPRRRKPSWPRRDRGAGCGPSRGARRCRRSGAGRRWRSCSWRSPRPLSRRTIRCAPNFRRMAKPPNGAALVRHRPDRPRHAQPRDPWQPGIADVAVGAVLLGTTLGALWGLACGYFGGRFDIISQRIIEFLQSFPDLILAMAIAMALGAGIGHGDRRDRHHPNTVRRTRDPLRGAVAEGNVLCRGGARSRRVASAA